MCGPTEENPGSQYEPCDHASHGCVDQWMHMVESGRLCRLSLSDMEFSFFVAILPKRTALDHRSAVAARLVSVKIWTTRLPHPVAPTAKMFPTVLLRERVIRARVPLPKGRDGGQKEYWSVGQHLSPYGAKPENARTSGCVTATHFGLELSGRRTIRLLDSLDGARQTPGFVSDQTFENYWQSNT